MKQIVWFKIVDVVAQLLALIIPVVMVLYDEYDAGFFIPYFTVGAWQLLSYLSNYYSTQKWYQSGMRKGYGVWLKCIVIVGAFCLLILPTGVAPVIIVYMVCMLILGPVMAVIYFTITISELRKLLILKTKHNERITEFKTI